LRSRAAGDRQSQTDHGTAGDTTTSHAYPAAGSATDQPHSLTGTTATGPTSPTHTGAYTYDKTGNTRSIIGGALGNETLTWTATGNLATGTTAGGTTSYAYTADGSKLVQRGPATTTLFLGDQEIVLNNTTKALTGTRYYSFNGRQYLPFGETRGTAPGSWPGGDKSYVGGTVDANRPGDAGRTAVRPHHRTVHLGRPGPGDH
jgi:hypothetical protein